MLLRRSWSFLRDQVRNLREVMIVVALGTTIMLLVSALIARTVVAIVVIGARFTSRLGRFRVAHTIASMVRIAIASLT